METAREDVAAAETVAKVSGRAAVVHPEGAPLVSRHALVPRADLDDVAGAWFEREASRPPRKRSTARSARGG